jgi:hypothetical protein
VSTSGPDRLYELLPLLYRTRDFDQGEPLRALLGVIGEEYDRIRASIAALEDAWFIETCDPKVIPFIADLVGVPRSELVRVPPRVQRPFVGNAIRYRRRKGVAAALERAIGDATGWTAHAVEVFEHLGVTQNVQHPSPDRGVRYDVRRAAVVVPEPGIQLGAYTVDVRAPSFDGGGPPREAPPASGDPDQPGRFNVRSLAVYVSRLQSYPVEQSEPKKVHPGCYTFHPLGLDVPLFNQPASDDDPLRPHDRTDLAARISPGAFEEDLTGAAATPRWFGPGTSIDVQLAQGTCPDVPRAGLSPSIDARAAVSRDLSRWDRPPRGHVAVDVHLGRIAFAPGDDPEGLRASWSFGRVTDIGAGPYPPDPAPAPDDSATWVAQVAAIWPPGPLLEQQFRTLAEAVLAWNQRVARAKLAMRGLIRLCDSSIYEVPGPGAPPTVSLDVGVHALRIEAELGEVPSIAAPIDVDGKGGSLALTGVELGGSLFCRGQVDLSLTSCTVHGSIEERDPLARPAFALLAGDKLAAERVKALDRLAADRVSLTLRRCLVGPVRIAGPTGVVTAEGSIIDGRGEDAIRGLSADAGPAVSLSSTTVIGDVSAEVLSQAETCLFTGVVRARRAQPSVLRFSAVPYASRDLPRYRTVLFGAPPGAPGATEQKRVIAGEPRFSSLDPGHPAYGRLADDCPPEILSGAEDGGEIGALHDVGAAGRRAELDSILGAFLPHHLSASVIFID